MHVDDFLWTGSNKFQKDIISRIKSIFEVGKEAKSSFKYIGLNLSQEEIRIMLTQKDYINNITEVKLDKREKMVHLSEDEKTVLCAKLGQLLWISKQSCPDIVFDATDLAGRINISTVEDLKRFNRIIKRVKSDCFFFFFGPFTQEELDSVLRKIKNRKAAGLDEIPPEVWKTRQFDDILLRHCNAVYNQNPIDRWTKGCILPFPKKGDLGLAKNYRGITLTSIAAKIYNALLRNRIEPKIDNILRKNQNGFRRNRSTTSQILTIRRILEGVRAKNLQATLIFVDFTKAFDSIQRKDGTNPTSVRHT